MSNWESFKLSYKNLINHAKNGSDNDILKSWIEFLTISNDLSQNPPLIFKTLQKTLITFAKKNYNIKIFDHGCGSGRMIFYFYAIGFKNVYGVNVNDDVEHLNKILSIVENRKIKSFFKTSGSNLPFKDNFFDVIISCQVLEHIPNNLIDTYYYEQSRCLKNAGLLYNEVPHRLNPYDSHTRTWFVHWLPNIIKVFLFKKFSNFFFKKIPIQIRSDHVKKICDGSFLILRTPSFHYKKLNFYNFKLKNITQLRLLSDFNDFSYDSDSNLGLRVFLDKMFKLKFIGKFFLLLSSNFFMITTVSLLQKKAEKPVNVNKFVENIYD